MSRACLILDGALSKETAFRWVAQAKPGTRLEFKAPKRTLDQNDLMWGLLTDLARQLAWHGVKLTPDDWKLVMLDGLKRELRLVPNIDGNGFVQLGRSSSDLTKDEFSQLIELILAFGAKHGVEFSYGEAA